MTSDAMFDAALRQHMAGNLAEAQVLYAQILEREPGHCDALHLMGVLAHQAGRNDVAERLIVAAIRVKPSAEYFANLALVLAAVGKIEDAAAACRQAIALSDNFPEAHNNLGNMLRKLGRHEDAVAAYRRAIELRPSFAQAENNLGLALGDAGDLDGAVAAFGRAIALSPNAADARNNLAGVMHRKGELQTAIACWREALSIQPNYPEAINNLGNALKEAGRIGEATAAFEQALALRPDFPEAYNNLGVILRDRGQLREAIAFYRNALGQRPDFAEAHYNLAIALHATGDVAHAIESCKRAIRIRGQWAEASNNLGIWLTETARPQDALEAFETALLARPDYAEAHSNLANALRQLGRAGAALESYHRAVALCPNSAETYNNLGNTLKQLGRMDEAIAAFRKALALHSDLSEAHNNLGNVLKDQGELDEAIACYERAVDLRPTDAEADSNRVYTLHFHPAYSAEKILAEHQRWNFRHAAAFSSQILPHRNDRDPARRLRIGYVAPDFREHCQSLFTVPLFSNHDHDHFEIFCYSDVAAPDAVTQRLRGYVDAWRNIAGMPDERVASLIREDQIDILVDLTVHMSHNRLLVFARKPAPIQVTWLGYPGTTGLETMDYRLSDPYLDPPEHDGFYSEQTIRLPHSFWCYDPLTDGPEINDLPASENGYVTFGCLNNFCKVNEETLRLWAQALRAAANSRLLLLAPQDSARERVLNVLASEQIAPYRIDFVSRQSRAAYLELYHRIDIGLDTFPYNGHTTSLDAFWMGVPVVTKVGTTAVGRAGFGQLYNLGLQELAAYSDEEFVQIACELANDEERLGDIRSELRSWLTQSPLMDAAAFAGGIENAYRGMWVRWASMHDAPPAGNEGRVSVRVYDVVGEKVRQAS